METVPADRKRRFAINSLFSAFSWVLPVVLAFIATPVLVNGLGSDLYGIYALITGFLSYSFGLGIGRAVVKFTSEFHASGDDARVREVIRTGLYYSLAIGSVGAAILLITTPYIVRSILLVPENHQAAAIAAFYISSISLVSALASQVFQAGLQGLSEFGVFLAISNLLAILLSAGNILLVVLGFGVDHLQAWNAFVLAIGGITYYLGFRKRFGIDPARVRPSTETRKLVARFSVVIVLYQLIGNSIYFFERAWVTRSFGTEPLAHYAIAFLLAFYLHGFVSSYSLVLFPVVNELMVLPDRQASLYQRSVKAILFIVVFTVVTFVVAGKHVLWVWLGQQLAAEVYPLLVVHSISIGMLTLLIVTWQLNESYRAARLNVIISVIWAVVGIPSMILLSDRFGVVGVALGRTAALAATVPFIFYAERRFLGRILIGFWLQTIFRMTVAAAALVFFYLLVLADAPTWPNLVFALTLGAGIFASVLYFVGYLSKDEWREIRSLLPVISRFRRDQ